MEGKGKGQIIAYAAYPDEDKFRFVVADENGKFFLICDSEEGLEVTPNRSQIDQFLFSILKEMEIVFKK